jgi:hypothetical protein
MLAAWVLHDDCSTSYRSGHGLDALGQGSVATVKLELNHAHFDLAIQLVTRTVPAARVPWVTSSRSHMVMA